MTICLQSVELFKIYFNIIDERSIKTKVIIILFTIRSITLKLVLLGYMTLKNIPELRRKFF